MAFGALLGFAAALLVWARTAQTSGCWAVSGALAGTHHWTQGNSYCVHSGSLVVGNGATLTIDPGVHVYFDSSSLIVVANGGKLFVNGTSTQPVNFTSVLSNGQPVRWVGIVFQAGSQGSLRHCVIEGAGGGGSPALWLESAITVEHCRIHHNTDEGVLLQGAGLTPVLRHVTLTHNGGYPIVESTIDMASVYEGISAANNVTNAVRSAGDFLYRHRTLDSASLGGLRFEVDDILVTAGNALTVTAGTEVRFNDEIIVQNNAGLFALGTATQPVTFTSSISPGVPGKVRYIAFGTGSRGVLRHCDVSSAGDEGALIIYSSAVTVEHCRIHHNAGDAVRVWNSSQPTFTCNQVFSNTFGMRNFTPATPVNARYNWWGHPSGPQHSSNPSGQGNAVSDGVQFVPFLTAPGGGICQLGMGPRAFVPTARQ